MNVFGNFFLGSIANALIAIISSLLLLFNVSSERKQPETLDVSDYRIVFDEEFDGASLNEAVWSPHEPDSVRKGGYWCFDQASVGDGCLTIRTEYKEDGKFGAGWYTAGVSTRNSFMYNYGYYECRCKLPKGQGLWSAFWLMNPNVGNTDYTATDGAEIDIFESPYYYLGGTLKNKVTHNVHYNGYGLETRYSNVGITSIANDPYENFNTYGLLWTPDCYIFYVNGKEVGRSAFGGVSTQPEYMILSCEVDGAEHTPTMGWSGCISLNGKDFTADFVVDYVRVYSLD